MGKERHIDLSMFILLIAVQYYQKKIDQVLDTSPVIMFLKYFRILLNVETNDGIVL